MSSFVTHDFKTPRPDGSRRLPRTFMLVPVLFYVTLAAGAYFGITSYMSYSDSIKSRDTWKQQASEQDGERKKLENDISNITKEKKKAEKLVQWVEGTRMLQPISVAITRAVPAEVSLGEVSFERSADIPAQINLGVRLNNGGMDEVSRIQNSIQELKYHAYNSQQIKTGDSLEYRTMLVWQQF